MISWHVFNSSTCWEINSGNYQVPGNLHGNPTQTLAGQSAFMLRTVSASQFPFSGLSSEDDRVAQAVGVPWWVTSTEGQSYLKCPQAPWPQLGNWKAFSFVWGAWVTVILFVPLKQQDNLRVTAAFQVRPISSFFLPELFPLPRWLK